MKEFKYRVWILGVEKIELGIDVMEGVFRSSRVG